MRAAGLRREGHLLLENLFDTFLKCEDIRMQQALSLEIRSLVDLHRPIARRSVRGTDRQAARKNVDEPLVLDPVEERHVVDLLLAELPEAELSDGSDKPNG